MRTIRPYPMTSPHLPKSPRSNTIHRGYHLPSEQDVLAFNIKYSSQWKKKPGFKDQGIGNGLLAVLRNQYVKTNLWLVTKEQMSRAEYPNIAPTPQATATAHPTMPYL